MHGYTLRWGSRTTNSSRSTHACYERRTYHSFCPRLLLFTLRKQTLAQIWTEEMSHGVSVINEWLILDSSSDTMFGSVVSHIVKWLAKRCYCTHYCRYPSQPWIVYTRRLQPQGKTDRHPPLRCSWVVDKRLSWDIMEIRSSLFENNESSPKQSVRHPTLISKPTYTRGERVLNPMSTYTEKSLTCARALSFFFPLMFFLFLGMFMSSQRWSTCCSLSVKNRFINRYVNV